MVNSSLRSEANDLLSGFYNYSFEKEGCTVYFKGSIHIDYEKIDIKKWITQLIYHLTDKESDFAAFLLSELTKISGLFSMVIKNGSEFYIAADIIRTFPVFYGFNNKDLFITNKLHEYQKQNNSLLIDNDKLEEYISSGFVFGNGTIYKNVYAVQAGELVIIKGKDISSKRYFEFKPAEKQSSFKNITEFSKAFDKVLISVFSRMIEQTPDVNRWLVPLSGGHDSRIIVNYLFRLGKKNVVCFTYGNSENEQSDLSRKVAEALGFEWHFVEYTEQKWQKLHEKGIIDEFIWYTFNGVSTPHLQDFLAVHELIEKGIIQEGDVFTPGMTFDFLTGCNFGQPDIACRNKRMAVERAYMAHTIITNWSCSPVRRIEDIYEKANVGPIHFQEYINWQEKRAKFSVNSLRTYEYFGFEARLPYWDKEIVDFWLRVPDNERIGRKLFFEAEKNGILVDQLIPIPFAGKQDRVSRNFIEELLRRLLPGFIKTFILRITARKVKYNAALNKIYALRASTVKDLLDPVEDFPAQVRPYFNNYLNRYTYQIDYHSLSTFYTIRKQLDRSKNL